MNKINQVFRRIQTTNSSTTNVPFLTLLMLISLFLFQACDDDPEIPNEEEVITSMTYTLTPIDGGTPVILSFQDLDGDGGDAPIITGGTLAINTTYTGTLQLLNETTSPAESINEEILAEAEEHQFFFQSTVNGLNITYNDTDVDGLPLGLETNLSTTEANNGTLNIILRHEPNKSADNVSSGDVTNAGGETDIEVTFDVNVE